MSSEVIGGAPVLAYRTTLTASGNFTVPGGVTLLNVRCRGGGGGGGGAGNSATNGSAGGSTTFGSFSALGGVGGEGTAVVITVSVANVAGTAAKANTGQAGSGGYIWSVDTNTAASAAGGSDGQELTDYMVVTPGQVIAYTIGAGGSPGNGSGVAVPGGTGGSGFIEVEWQV